LEIEIYCLECFEHIYVDGEEVQINFDVEDAEDNLVWVQKEDEKGSTWVLDEVEKNG